jgi:hypothetical protein
MAEAVLNAVNVRHSLEEKNPTARTDRTIASTGP